MRRWHSNPLDGITSEVLKLLAPTWLNVFATAFHLYPVLDLQHHKFDRGPKGTACDVLRSNQMHHCGRKVHVFCIALARQGIILSIGSVFHLQGLLP